MWVGLMAVALAGAAAMAAAAPAAAQEGRGPMGIEDLKALYAEASLLAQVQVETVQARPDVAPRLVWEVKGPVLEVIKGDILPGKISVHVDSVVRAFDLRREDLEGKQFLMPLKTLGESTDRRYQLVGPFAFPAGGSEAEALRQLAETDMTKGSGGQPVQLVVQPLAKVFPVEGPKTIEIRLTNTGTGSVTYLQTPIAEKDGKLFITGRGMLTLRDASGRGVTDKGNVVAGQVPPPPPTPALILPNMTYTQTLDLAKYFTLSEGRYTLALHLATPDGRDRLSSNAFSFQVGAVNLPETPEPAVEIVAYPPPKPLTPDIPAPPAAPAPNVPAPDVPAPESYAPGKASAGLAAMLRPTKAAYKMGEPVTVELRLINEGPRTLAVDARLERTLTVTVEPVGDSPQPLVIRQVIPWPADGMTMPDERAHLREGAFWGSTLNLNTLYGKALAEQPAPTAEEISAGRNFTYERFGKNLFGFSKAGYYKITATYVVLRPKPVEGQEPAAQAKDWWIGEVQTNSVTIRVGEPGKK
jgi:hypothetical protein